MHKAIWIETDVDATLKIELGALTRRHRRTLGLSRRQLAERSGLPEKTVRDVEDAEKAHLDRRTVLLLAHGLGLINGTRRAFILAAGLDPREPAEPSDLWHFTQRFYKNAAAPAFIVDSCWRIHSLNQEMVTLWFGPTATPEACWFEGAGPHLLRFLFDPAFDLQKRLGDTWQPFALIHTQLFMLAMGARLSEPAVRSIIEALGTLPNFHMVWRMAGVADPPPAPVLYSIPGPQGEWLSFQAACMGPSGMQLEGYLPVMYTPVNPQARHVFESIRPAQPTAWQLGREGNPTFTRIV